MKSILLRAGLLTCIIFLGWSYQQASAEMNFPSKCGEIPTNVNPSPQQINCLLTNAALEAQIPPEVVKAVAAQESDWRQFFDDQNNGGIGIMQITNQPNYDQERLKTDISYNIEAGVQILSSMYNRSDLPKIKGAGRDVIENWYFPVMAYNGTKPINSPLFQADGTKNTDAYQEKVFSILEQDSFLGGTELAAFPFNTSDFDYQTNSDQNIKFNKLEYILTDQMHASTYLLKKGDKVVTMDRVNLRSDPGTRSSIYLDKNTTLTIDGDFVYDPSNGSNRFVLFPVKTADQTAGYVSSAYIVKKLDAPSVNPINDHDVVLTGKAPANSIVQVMNGATLISSTLTDSTGTFKADIAAQTAGTNLTLTYKDHLNQVSPSVTITVTSWLNGWVTQNGGRYHYTNGVLNTGWYKEGFNYFYLDPTNAGAMKTGWLKDGSYWYYLDRNGIMKTGWVFDGQSWYYLAGSGKMLTGWVLDGQSWYYLAGSGKMLTGWVKDGQSWYYLASSGKMLTGWVKLGQDWYYLAGSGKMLTGWQKISGSWYYFYSSGVMAHDTKIGNYRLGNSGAML